MWCRDCIHEGERAVGVMAVSSPEWCGPDHLGSSRLVMRLRDGRDWGLLFMPMVKLVSGGCGVEELNVRSELEFKDSHLDLN